MSYESCIFTSLSPFAEAARFLDDHTKVFLYNTLLIYLSTLIVFLFRNRIFWRILIAVFWMLLGISNGILLANHGMAACGHSLKNAYGIALAMEWCAELQWRCMCAGAPHYLSAKQMEGVMKRYETYGQIRQDGTKPHGYSG